MNFWFAERFIVTIPFTFVITILIGFINNTMQVIFYKLINRLNSLFHNVESNESESRLQLSYISLV